MPALANITVKKADALTDVIYTGVAPSAGDKIPAIWRNNTVGTAAAHRPELRLSARSNGTNSARRVEGTFRYPTTVIDAQGKISVSDQFLINFSALVPLGMPDNDVNEATAQSLNLMASLLIKDSVKSGFAPT